MKNINKIPRPVNAWPWIVLGVLLVWGRTLGFDFVWDDFPTLVSNPSLLRWSTLFSAFGHDFWALHEVPVSSGYWRPIPTLVYLLTYQIFGLQPWAFHTVNVAAHLVTALLVSVLFFRLGGEGWVLTLSCLFFAIHPIHSESVSFISALPDLLAAVFGLGAVLLWTTPSRNEGRGFQVAGAILFLLALLSKESAVVFGLVWGWLALGPLRRVGAQAPRSRFRILLFLSVSTLVYVLCHVWVTGGVGVRDFWGGTLGSHLGTVLQLFPVSALLTLFPFPLTPTRDFPISSGWTDIRTWIAVVTILGIAILLFWGRRKEPRSLVGVMLLFLFWLPVSNILPAEGLIADRYLYLPSLGSMFLVGLLVQRTLRLSQPARKRFQIFWILLLVSWGGAAFHASRHWKNDESLWRHAISVSPSANLAWNEWGKVLLGKGDLDGAAEAIHRALELQPNYREAKLNLTLVEYKQGHTQKALERVTHHLAERPSDAEGWDVRAALHSNLGDHTAAAIAGRRAIELAPTNWKFYFNYGLTLLSLERHQEAIQILEKGRSWAPHRREIWVNLAAAQFHEGQWGEAKETYQQILLRWPEDEGAKRSLSTVEKLLQIKGGKTP